MQKNPTFPLDQTQVRVRVNTFVRAVYNWMAIGLALTGFVAYYVAQNESLFQMVHRSKFLLFIALFGLVIGLSAGIRRINATTATLLFTLYAALNGAFFSYIFKIFDLGLIAATFFICAVSFLALSIFGWATKKDLTGVGNFMFMGLVGIIIASFVNLFFLKSYGMHMIISYLGVLVFAGLTAYDTQKIKMMALSQPANLDAAVVRKGAIIGALQLYLDFILLFQYLLVILGGRRN